MLFEVVCSLLCAKKCLRKKRISVIVVVCTLYYWLCYLKFTFLNKFLNKSLEFLYIELPQCFYKPITSVFYASLCLMMAIESYRYVCFLMSPCMQIFIHIGFRIRSFVETVHIFL